MRRAACDDEQLIGSRVLETDQHMAPPCRGECKFKSRQLVTITEAPQFLATREVPVVADARRTDPGCKRLDIIDIALREQNLPPGRPWTKIWTSWVCGTLVTSEVRCTPRPGRGVDYSVR